MKMNEQLSRYEDSFGYGVRNVNKRIELLFGEDMVLISEEWFGWGNLS